MRDIEMTVGRLTRPNQDFWKTLAAQNFNVSMYPICVPLNLGLPKDIDMIQDSV